MDGWMGEEEKEEEKLSPQLPCLMSVCVSACVCVCFVFFILLLFFSFNARLQTSVALPSASRDTQQTEKAHV